MIDTRNLIASCAFCAAMSGCTSAGPDVAARQFEQRRIAGDLAQIPPLLLPTEAQALSSGGAALSDAGIAEIGLPSATVDSAQITGSSADSATVDVYLTAPNTRALMGDLFARAMAGQLDTSKSGVRKALATVPRITVVDTVSLVRIGKEWKVWLRLSDRHAAKVAAKQLHDAYRDDDLSTAAKAASALLEVQAKSKGIVDSDDVAKAHDVIGAQSLADSIQADLVVERGFLGGAIRGYVRNLSGRKLVDVVLRVRDANGAVQKVSVHRIDPGERKAVFELAGSLASGRPAATNVAWINLGAWDGLGF